MFDSEGVNKGANRVGTFFPSEKPEPSFSSQEVSQVIQRVAAENMPGINYTDEYNQARAIGAVLLPILNMEGVLPVQKHSRMGGDEMKYYKKVLSSRSEAGVQDVKRAIQASITFSLMAGEAVGNKSFKRGFAALANHSATVEQARDLYLLQQTMRESLVFMNEQIQRNPELVNDTFNGFFRKEGSIIALQDAAGKRIYAKTLLEGAQYAFPDNNMSDKENPFYPYRKFLRDISFEAPHVSSLSTLVPDKKPLEEKVKISGKNRVFDAIKARLTQRQKAKGVGTSTPVPAEA